MKHTISYLLLSMFVIGCNQESYSDQKTTTINQITNQTLQEENQTTKHMNNEYSQKEKLTRYEKTVPSISDIDQNLDIIEIIKSDEEMNDEEESKIEDILFKEENNNTIVNHNNEGDEDLDTIEILKSDEEMDDEEESKIEEVFEEEDESSVTSIEEIEDTSQTDTVDNIEEEVGTPIKKPFNELLDEERIEVETEEEL